MDEEQSVNTSKLKEYVATKLKVNENNCVIDNMQVIKVRYASSLTEYYQFSVDCTFKLRFAVHLKIDYTVENCFYRDAKICNKLRICIADEKIRQELISHTNYLQRQKNIQLMMSILKKISELVSERQIILDIATLHSQPLIKIKRDDLGNVLIKCKDVPSKFKFFECSWKIMLSYTTDEVTDFIDFSVTKLDLRFNCMIHDEILVIIQPSITFRQKLDCWWSIIRAVNLCLENCARDYKNLGVGETLRMHSVVSNQDEDLQIIESDDEDCLIVEN